MASGKIGLGPADFIHALGGRDGFLGFFLFPLGKELVNLEFGEGVLGKGDTLLFVSLLFLAFIGFLLGGRHFLGVGLFLLFARSVRFLCLGDRGVLIIWLCLGVFGLLLRRNIGFLGLGRKLAFEHGAKAGDDFLALIEVAVLEVGDAEKLEATAAFVDILQGFEFAGLAEFGELFPHFELLEGGEKSPVAVESASTTLGQGVVFGMTGERNHVAGKGHGLAHPTDGGKVATEPLVVVRVVVNLVRHDAILLHVGVVDASRRFLTAGGVMVALELGINMAGHMPHVSDAGRGLPADGRRIHRSGGPFVVPKVDAVVMGGMHGVDLENRLDKGVHGFMALNLHTVAGVDPELESQQGPGLQVVRKLVENLFQGLGVGLGPLGFLLLGRVYVLGESIHVLDLLGDAPSLALDRLRDETLGPLLVARIGPGHAPVSHGASRVDDGGLTEGALGLQVPKTMELTDPLVEESLALGLLGGHGKVHLGHAFHEVGPLAGAFVERFAVSGMPGGYGCVAFLPLGEKRHDEQNEQDGFHPPIQAPSWSWVKALGSPSSQLTRWPFLKKRRKPSVPSSSYQT